MLWANSTRTWILPIFSPSTRQALNRIGIGRLTVEDTGGDIDHVRIAWIDPDVARQVIAAPDRGPVLAAVRGLIHHPGGHVELATVARLAVPQPTGQLCGRVDGIRSARVDREAAEGDALVLHYAVVNLGPGISPVPGLEDTAHILGAHPDGVIVARVDRQAEDRDRVTRGTGAGGDAAAD